MTHEYPPDNSIRELAMGIDDLFRMGKSSRLLELNRVVLCGDDGRQQDCSAHRSSGIFVTSVAVDLGERVLKFGVTQLLQWQL